MVISMTYSNYFFTYFSLLALSTLAICGWFAATRGWKVLLPNGKEEKHGKILKAWYFYWFQEKGKKRLYYEGRQLGEIRDRINALTQMLIVKHGDARLISTVSEDKFKAQISRIEDHLKVNVSIDLNFYPKEAGYEEGNTMFTVYKEEPDYKYPEWIRDMMAGCITCHATIYGNIIFWAFALCAKYTILGDDVYVFFCMSKTGFLFTWLSYWVSLAYTCTVAWQKMPD